jgi:hypothetical protein
VYNFKTTDIIKILVGKDMEIHVISGGKMEVLSRYLLGRTEKKQENLYSL